MPRLCLLLAGLLLALVQTARAGEQITLYGDDAYPPYSYVEYGQFKGIYVDLLRQIGAGLEGYDLILKPVPWKHGLAMLKSGESMALFPPYQLGERNYITQYSAPLLRETIVIVCSQPAMSRPRQHFPDDFGDITIGVNAGFLLTESLQAAIRAGKARVEEAKGNEANLLKLASGRIGCYANDRLAITHALKKLKATHPTADAIQRLQLAETVELASQDARVGFGVALPPAYRDDFIDKLNAALRDARQNGDIERLVGFYLM
ncbi:substrate-binding periplasmic protein [Chitinilyticum aquatile]|uniref:substrate-binding periplasmic protein n=1 Tax=Chitinilyticum aquatile TaxID=362520 RepID=UPI0004073DCB|nr:transporter substrate-binding domain-containing protein [Chitinilyticum aquatile]